MRNTNYRDYPKLKAKEAVFALYVKGIKNNYILPGAGTTRFTKFEAKMGMLMVCL